MVVLPRKFAWTVARRTLFIAALLLIGPITVSVFHHFQTPTAPGLPPIAVFAWGLDSIGTVLAVWLVARAGIWRNWQGFLRVASYVIAFAYGRMMFAATQDWLTTSGVNFRFPGRELDDYARPALDLLSLLMFVWLLNPVVILTGTVLSRPEELTKRTRQFTITGVLGFTTIAAIAIVWIGFLTSHLAPQTYYSHLSQSDAIRNWLGTYLPFTIPPLIAAMLILYGLTKRWWFALLAFSGAIALDACATKIIASVAEFMTGQQQGGILGGAPLDRWLYICGRSSTVYCAFLTATIMGVRTTFGNDETIALRQNEAIDPSRHSSAF